MKLGFLGSDTATPFPPLRIPPYTPVDLGAWKLRLMQGPPIIRGYFGGLQACTPHNWMLTHKGKVWMSVTPMELESAAHHALEARDNVMVMGFGMGVLAWNIARKDSVKTVQVVEKDSDVVALARRLSTLPGWEKLREKMVIHHADALTFEGVADVVIADIWPSLGDTKLRPDLRKMATNVRAEEFAAWGLELDFIEWCSKQGCSPDLLRAGHWIAYSKDIGVPLIMAKSMSKSKVMVDAALSAARNVLMY